MTRRTPIIRNAPSAGRIVWPVALLVVMAAAAVSLVDAQQRPTQPDLTFPREAKELGFFSSLEMGIWKPKGQGPFPALIVVHSCAGLGQSIGYWRKEAVRRGYVVFVVDSFSSRGAATCKPLPPVPQARGVKDVFDAAEHLKKFPFVNQSQIAMLGLSWGAMVGLRSASPGFLAQVGLPSSPLRAVVGLYPACYMPAFGSATTGTEILHGDVSTPTLVLMGGQDNELPPQECLSRLEPLKERGAVVEWHVFPNATHCWDCSDQHNQRWSPPWAGGRSVVYFYDSKVTDESAERAFEFLARRLKTEGKS